MTLIDLDERVIAHGELIRFETGRWCVDGRYILDPDGRYQIQPEPPPAVPPQVEMAQARLALLAAGHLASVDAIIEALPEPQRTAAMIEWEFRSTVRRASPLVAQIGAVLELTNEQVDALFIAAAAL